MLWQNTAANASLGFSSSGRPPYVRQDRYLTTSRHQSQAEPALHEGVTDEADLLSVRSKGEAIEQYTPMRGEPDVADEQQSGTESIQDENQKQTLPIRRIQQKVSEEIENEETENGQTENEETEKTLASKGSDKGSQGPELVKAEIDGRSLVTMAKTMRAARQLGLPDTSVSYQPEPTRLESPSVRTSDAARIRFLRRSSRTLLQVFTQKKRDSHFKQRMIERLKLPMMERTSYDEIFRLLDTADVLVIAGHTGSGKTTQVPQMILDHAIHNGRGGECNVVCTQPRRISATSIARRVAYERCEPVGDSVGYHVRFDRRYPRRSGNMLYCTTGVLLKQIQENPDRYMTETSHMIVDEVHERSIDTDHLLTYLRELINARKARREIYPKVILMSATVDSKALVEYFEQDLGSSVGAGLETRFMEVPGRLFPVTSHFLGEILPEIRATALQDKTVASWLDGTSHLAGKTTRDYLEKEEHFMSETKKPLPDTEVDSEENDDEDDVEIDTEPVEEMNPCGLAAAAFVHVLNQSSEGDILIFLPGLTEIEKTADMLTAYRPDDFRLFDTGKFKLFKLHSSMGDLNDEVFDPIQEGCRRVVLATNIAESSITLPKVEHVIDMGKGRRLNHDHLSGDLEFSAHWISKAESKQRLGRAGRVRPGHYYTLFSEERYDTFEDFAPPEITQLDLAGSCLDVIAQTIPLDAASFLSRCPTPPRPEVVTSALSSLTDMGALTTDRQLTALGRALSWISLEPSKAKAVMLGILFSCLEPMLIVACLPEGTPIVYSPVDRINATASRRAFSGTSESDLLSDIAAFQAYDKAWISEDQGQIQTLISDQHVRISTYNSIKLSATQVYEQLVRARLVPPIVHRGKNFFSVVPTYLNENSGNIPLVKALLMMTLNPNLGVSHDKRGLKWWTPGPEKALLAPRTVNRRGAYSTLTSIGRIRKKGDVLAYDVRRDVAGERYPWIQGSTMITPLMALLFSTAAEKSGAAININKMFDLKVDVKNNSLGIDEEQANVLTLEFRKSIDRFCKLAFEDLRHASLQSPDSEENKQMGQGEAEEKAVVGRELKNAFVGGVAELLKTEDDALQQLFKNQKEAQRLEAERAAAAAKADRDKSAQEKQGMSTLEKRNAERANLGLPPMTWGSLVAERKKAKSKREEKRKVAEEAAAAPAKSGQSGDAVQV